MTVDAAEQQFIIRSVSCVESKRLRNTTAAVYILYFQAYINTFGKNFKYLCF